MRSLLPPRWVLVAALAVILLAVGTALLSELMLGFGAVAGVTAVALWLVAVDDRRHSSRRSSP